ncbi:MmgE/PrpD family protein [Marinobacter sp. JSM 1782161]|uniref:MmgE/PrpD family protein n=1 Tax=Marinobacter sp. JSM 1782161 TaxID=2685906 RepID=UPI0014041079|nr:MmgE/PrpD family protein [Marinobacter sp. JSM 1782161]
MTSNLQPLDWIQSFTPDQLEPDAMAHAKRCLLDLVGVAAGATATPLADKARRFTLSQYGGERPLLFADGRTSPAGVALHGAWLIDALDAHDGQVLTKGHVGVAVLPGLLALPEVNALSGRAFLGLLVLGYEVATRAGIALHASADDYHTSGAWNGLAVAAVCSRLLGSDRDTLHHALGIAEFYGPRSQMMRCIDHPTMLKDGSGWGALAGVSAALLAADGFSGAPTLTVTDPALAPIWADLGERWYLYEQYFKAYPVCRWAQPAAEAALSIRPQGIDPARIACIEIETFHEAKRLHTRAPADTEQAQYSLPWSVACALVRGTVDTDSVTRALGDPLITRLAQRVVITESDAFNEAFPARRWAHATLVLDDGRAWHSDAMEARGDPHTPLSDEEIRTKYRALASPVLGAEATAELETVIDTLDERPVTDLLDKLVVPGKAGTA